MTPLTRRETEVLALLADGCSRRRQVAERMGISDETVKTHLGKAMAKLGARTPTHAVAEAIRRGIIAGPAREARS